MRDSGVGNADWSSSGIFKCSGEGFGRRERWAGGGGKKK